MSSGKSINASLKASCCLTKSSGLMLSDFMPSSSLSKAVKYVWEAFESFVNLSLASSAFFLSAGSGSFIAFKAPAAATPKPAIPPAKAAYGFPVIAPIAAMFTPLSTPDTACSFTPAVLASPPTIGIPIIAGIASPCILVPNFCIVVALFTPSRPTPT